MYVCTFKEGDKKNNIPDDGGHILGTDIDSTDFKNQNVTEKIRRKKAEKPYFLKKIFQKILKHRKPSMK